MIQSLFLLSPTGEILIERHFRDNTPRSICQYYWDKASVSLNHHGGLAATSASVSTSLASSDSLFDTVPPVLEVPLTHQGSSNKSLYLFSILRDGLSYLAACPSEVSPLLVLEFLHRVADTFSDYFGNPADENAIKENFSTVYQLLEEMLDHGWPLTTEPNALQDMIRPPTVMGKITEVVTGSNAVVAESLPKGTISNMPWRKAGVKYAQNEIYVDIVEEIDAIVDVTGRVVSTDVSGSIQAQSHLSGVPDLLMTFKDPDVIDDCSFHPCVRYTRFELDRVVSFVPPDGNFELMKYRTKNNSSILNPPISCIPQFSYGETKHQNTNGTQQGSVSVMINIQPNSCLTFTSKKGSLLIEEVSCTISFPKIVKTANLTVNMGNVLYDEAAKVAKWVIGKLDQTKKPHLQGSMLLNANEDTPEENPPLQLTWKIPQSSVSGLSVSGLSMVGETYRPYKGVRTITKSGRFQVRCS